MHHSSRLDTLLAAALGGDSINWDANVAICDMLSSCPSLIPEVLLEIRNGFEMGDSPNIQLCLTLLEMLVKNCGYIVCSYMTDGFMKDMYRLASVPWWYQPQLKVRIPSGTERKLIKAKVLSLVQEWCDAFILREGQLESLFKAYKELRRRKEPFPPRDETVRFQIKGAEESPALNPNLATTKHTTAETKAMVLSPSEVENLRDAVYEIYSMPNLPRRKFEADYAEACAGRSRLRATIERAFEDGKEDSSELSDLLTLSDMLEEVLNRIQATGSATKGSSVLLSSSLKNPSKPAEELEGPSALPQVSAIDILSGDTSQVPPPPPQEMAPDVATQIENDRLLALYLQDQEDMRSAELDGSRDAQLAGTWRQGYRAGANGSLLISEGTEPAVATSRKQTGSVSNAPAHRIRLESYSSGPPEAADHDHTDHSAAGRKAYTGLRQMVNGMLLARKTKSKEHDDNLEGDEAEGFLDDDSTPNGGGQGSSIVVPVSEEWSVVRDRSSGVSYWHNNTTGETQWDLPECIRKREGAAPAE
ncbi:hypothetical protein FOZ61_007932 [Perkinsus olseni]|uniref:Uncharacterized protein n=1 Tax=Perkinsus olseni TaxID=32597 RepID=A0A7J6MPT1_PEROL|nr:hypothetical protein FOZ61_007932 [Perkinsus olseni]KAF4673406.1 hypothetical protein FOL46_007321 [Perkinsus olseni]